jgi:hypothetical protein
MDHEEHLQQEKFVVFYEFNTGADQFSSDHNLIFELIINRQRKNQIL